jgi:uncharacterized glyoxalase superfamily protein PhnB
MTAGVEAAFMAQFNKITPVDVQIFFARVKDRVEIVWPLEKMDYGSREFGVRDPDGYVLAFSQTCPDDS